MHSERRNDHPAAYRDPVGHEGLLRRGPRWLHHLLRGPPDDCFELSTRDRYRTEPWSSCLSTLLTTLCFSPSKFRRTSGSSSARCPSQVQAAPTGSSSSWKVACRWELAGWSDLRRSMGRTSRSCARCGRKL